MIDQQRCFMEQKIDEIMHVMNSIEYGFRDENNKNIIYDE